MEAIAATAEEENGKSLESTPDPKKKKNRKRRKKKQVEMVGIASGNEAEIGGPSTELSKTSDQEEDGNESFNLEDKVTPVKESEEHDVQVSETASKKKKKKKKDIMVSEVNLNHEDVNADNKNMFGTPEKVNSKFSFVEEGIKDPVAVESDGQEPVEDGQPPTEGGDVLIGDIRRDSGEGYNDFNKETIPTGKDEKPPLVPDEEGGSSTPEAVTDRETDGSVTITTTADGAAYGPVVDSSSINLSIGDDMESDAGDDSCDVPVDNDIKGSMVSEVNLNPENINLFSTPKKVNSKSSFVEEGIKDPVAVESEEQEPVEDGLPQTECGDVLIGDIRRDSGEGYNDLDEETIPTIKDEKLLLIPNKEGGSSTPEAVTDRETDGSATITTSADGAAYEPVVDSSSINLSIVDDVESDTGDDLCDVAVDNEG